MCGNRTNLWSQEMVHVMVIVAKLSNSEDLALIFLSITYCTCPWKDARGLCNFCALEIPMVSQLTCYSGTFCIFCKNGSDGDCNFLCSSCVNPCPRRCCIWWLLVPNYHTRRMSPLHHQFQYLLITYSWKRFSTPNMGFILRVGFYLNIYQFWTMLPKGECCHCTAVVVPIQASQSALWEFKPPNLSCYLARSSKFETQYMWSHSMVMNGLTSFTLTVYHVCYWYLYGNTGRWPSRCGVHHWECNCHGIPAQWFKLWTSRLCRGTAPNWCILHSKMVN